MAGADRADRLVEESLHQAPDLVTGLVRVLDRALRALGDQGHRDAACRMAAEAWALLEPERSPEARRLNGTLHYLTRQPMNRRGPGAV